MNFHMRHVLIIMLLASGGCAGASQPTDEAGLRSGRQQEAALQAQEQLSLARALTEMADRRRVEADILSRDLGANNPETERKRQLAQDLEEAATEALDRARELRGQVPHGMVQ